MLDTARAFGLCEPGRLTGIVRVPVTLDDDVGGSEARVGVTFVVTTKDDPGTPAFYLKTLNVVFDPLEGRSGQLAPSACLAGASTPELAFEPESREVSSEFELNTDFTTAHSRYGERDPHSDTAGAVPVSTRAELRGQFLTDLNPNEMGSEVFQFDVRIELPEPAVKELGLPEVNFGGTVGVNWLWGPYTRSLMVQPVFLAPRLTTGISGVQVERATGIAFDSLLFRANSIWAKCCIQFIAKTPIYLTTQSYRTLEEDEEQSLLDEVNEPDAIEVFVVERFEPEDRRGGGVTFNRGTAEAKVITGDNQLPDNPNHLAHELGHVLNLRHPGEATDTSPDGCVDSVLEPSGFFRDNPRCQCQRNCDNASNPLLFEALWPVCDPPDRNLGRDDLF